MKTTKKAKPIKSLNLRGFKLLFNLCPHYYIFETVSQIAVGILPFIPIYFSAKIISELSGARNLTVIWHYVFLTLLTTGILSIVKCALSRVTNYYKNIFGQKMECILSDKMISLDYPDIDDQKTKALVSQINQNRDSGGYGFYSIYSQTPIFVNGLTKVITVIGMTASLFTQKVSASSQFAFLNNVFFPIGLIVLLITSCWLFGFFISKSAEYWYKNTEANKFGNRTYGYVCNMLGNSHNDYDIRVYNVIDNTIDLMNKNITNCYGKHSYMSKMARTKMGFEEAMANLMPFAFLTVVYAYVGVKCYAGAFDIGSATRYISALAMLFDGVKDILVPIQELKENKEFMKVIFKYLDMPNKMYMGSLTTEKRTDCKYELEFKNVSFKYPGSDIYALKNLSFKFKIGEKLAIVGQNGSGKTTFIKLLCRLYDPTEGEILLNGINIQKYNYDDYMNIFSVVFQDFELLPLTLGENVATSDEYDRERVLKCLDDAGFTERLKNLPDGLDTYISKKFDKNGVNVSGGESQKIAIARALYRNSPFVILDEPTAALDPIAESEIYSKFNTLVKDKSAIYISHRLSSCRFCEKIAVFDHGTVVQTGSHDELLLDENGKYSQLWNAQAQYYK